MNKGIIFGAVKYMGRPAPRECYVAFDGIVSTPPLALFTEAGTPLGNNHTMVDREGYFVFRFQWELGGIGGALNDTNLTFRMRGFRPSRQGPSIVDVMTRATGRAVVLPTADMFGALMGTNPPGGGDHATESLLLDMASIRRGLGITSLPFLAPSRSILENLGISGLIRIDLI